MERITRQPARLLEPRILEGLEKRLNEQGGLRKPLAGDLYKELIETRAIGRELIGHVNALEGIAVA